MSVDQMNDVIMQKLYQEDGELFLKMFGLDHHVATLTLVGDTKYKEHEMEPLRPFFKCLVEALAQLDFPIVVIDGATDFGVMKLFGDACTYAEKKPAALIGITLQAAIEQKKMPLEPHHSHVLLAQGREGEWLKAVPLMEQVRALVTGGEPSALLAVGGGAVTLRHMYEHAQAGVPLYVLLGSGLLPQGFVEAKKIFPDPAYPYALDEHKYLLSRGGSSVTLLDSANIQQAVETLMQELKKQKREINGNNIR